MKNTMKGGEVIEEMNNCFTAEEQERFRRLGFGHEMGFGDRPALLVVDFQKSFTNPTGAHASNLDSEVQATAEVLKLARQKGVPIVYTIEAYDEGCEASFGVWLKKAPNLTIFKSGSEACEIDTRLKPLPGEHIIIKKFPSAFFGTYLSSLLTGQGIDTVIVTGCITSGCVRATVVDALQHGFRPIVPRECVGDRDQGAHQGSLFDIHGRYGDVVFMQTVLDYLNALPDKSR